MTLIWSVRPFEAVLTRTKENTITVFNLPPDLGAASAGFGLVSTFSMVVQSQVGKLHSRIRYVRDAINSCYSATHRTSNIAIRYLQV